MPQLEETTNTFPGGIESCAPLVQEFELAREQIQDKFSRAQSEFLNRARFILLHHQFAELLTPVGLEEFSSPHEYARLPEFQGIETPMRELYEEGFGITQPKEFFGPFGRPIHWTKEAVMLGTLLKVADRLPAAFTTSSIVDALTSVVRGRSVVELGCPGGYTPEFLLRLGGAGPIRVVDPEILDDSWPISQGFGVKASVLDWAKREASGSVDILLSSEFMCQGTMGRGLQNVEEIVQTSSRLVSGSTVSQRGLAIHQIFIGPVSLEFAYLRRFRDFLAESKSAAETFIVAVHSGILEGAGAIADFDRELNEEVARLTPLDRMRWCMASKPVMTVHQFQEWGDFIQVHEVYHNGFYCQVGVK